MILTSITLITLDTRGGDSGLGGTVRNAARDAFAPVQDGVDQLLNPVADWWDGVTKAGSIKDENRRLRRELQAARGEVATGRAARIEIQKLKQLAKLPFAPTIPGVDAQIVIGSPGNFEATVTVNKGTDDGVGTNMPVVSGAGLLGRIARVSVRRATVLLLTDRDSGVGLRDTRSQVKAVLNGNPDTPLQTLDALEATSDVKVGDDLVTIGSAEGPFQSPYPPDVPVGKVVAVRKRPGDLTQRVTIRLLADASTTEFVRVLQWPVP
ncbi:MAG: rod shape-determining protein MreC [Acidimicrobiia bacterium]